MMSLDEIDRYMKRSLASSKGFKWGANKRWVDIAIELRERVKELEKALEEAKGTAPKGDWEYTRRMCGGML
jgi:hypothetical protein